MGYDCKLPDVEMCGKHYFYFYIDIIFRFWYKPLNSYQSDKLEATKYPELRS